MISSLTNSNASSHDTSTNSSSPLLLSFCFFLESVNSVSSFEKYSNSILHLDANDSIGFVAADFAIKQAIKLAKKTGIGIVGVKNSGHYGLSGYYIEQAVKKNLLALCFTNAPPAIAPYGAKKSLFGTNPISFGTPSGSRAPFIFASSMCWQDLPTQEK